MAKSNLSAQNQFIYDCVIVGAGPGGLVSSLYLARFNRHVAIVDSGFSRASWIPKIRNFSTYHEGLSGKELLAKLHRQVANYNVPIFKGFAYVRRKRGLFEVSLGAEKLLTKNVILATGMRDIQPGFSNEDALRKKGLLAYCPICDGFEYTKDRMGLLVQSNSGLKKIKFLHQITPKLYIVQKRKFKVASKYIKLMRELGVQLLEGPLEDIKPDRSRKMVKVKMADSTSWVPLRVLYVGLGTKVNMTAVKHINSLRRNKQGFLLTDTHQETTVHGLFAVGDCVSGLSQVSVAIGQAAVAATRIHNRLL